MSIIPQTPRASGGGGGLAPLDPLPGLCLGPAGDLKRSPDPSPTHAPTNHKSWIRPCVWYDNRKTTKLKGNVNSDGQAEANKK